MYFILIISAFMLQNNLFAAIKWIDCTPNLLLIVTFCFGFIRGRTHGMLIGFFCGLLSDLFFGTYIGYYAFIYTLMGYCNGIVGHLFFTEFLNMPALLCAINELALCLYVYITRFLLNGATNFGYYFLHVILPELVYTVLITLIIYKGLLKLDAWMERLETRGAKRYV